MSSNPEIKPRPAGPGRIRPAIAGALTVLILATIITGFLLGLMLIVGQVVKPGAAGFNAAMRNALPLFAVTLGVSAWRYLAWRKSGRVTGGRADDPRATR